MQAMNLKAQGNGASKIEKPSKKAISKQSSGFAPSFFSNRIREAI